jgi:hypothetical protein
LEQVLKLKFAEVDSRTLAIFTPPKITLQPLIEVREPAAVCLIEFGLQNHAQVFEIVSKWT